MQTSRPNVLKRIAGYISSYGISTTAYLIKNKLKSMREGSDYAAFIKNTEADIYETEPIENAPLFSFICCFLTDSTAKRFAEGLKAQTLRNYELLFFDAPADKTEDGVRFMHGTRDEAAAAAVGEYMVFADSRCFPAPNMLYGFTLAAIDGADIIYSDEDGTDEDGNRRDPVFKPAFSPDTLMNTRLYGSIWCLKKVLYEPLDFFPRLASFENYAEALFFSEKTDRITHIPKILYHVPQKENKQLNNAEIRREALARRGISARVEDDGRVIYLPAGEPLVSIIIPSKDNCAILERCLLTLTEKTEYKNCEIIVVDNGSSDENKEKYALLCKKVNAAYLYEKKDFNFSYMCNKGAAAAKGEYLLFLNDDMEIINRDWLSLMLGQAMQPHTGAVGAKLLYPDSTVIQHCGVINIPLGPSHAFVGMNDSKPLYGGLNRITHNCIAVTAACLMVGRAKFDEVGGFDESFVVAYNDIDLCFRLFEAGYFNTVRADAVLYHHESVSRGNDMADRKKLLRLGRERYKLYAKHPALNGTDPFYNPNLVKTNIDYSLDMTKRSGGNKISGTDIKLPPANKNIKAHLDTVKRGETTEFYGWAYIEGMRANNLNRLYLILEDENGRVFKTETEKMLRLDVNAQFGTKNELDLSGFRARIKTNGIIKKGKYRVGVLIENAFTHKKAAVWFDEAAAEQKQRGYI